MPERPVTPQVPKPLDNLASVPESVLDLEPDKSTELFAALRNSKWTFAKETWSESDTRSKLIDTLLIDCLHWSENDIRRELSHDRQRLDYALSLIHPIMIIEAKRASVGFPINKHQSTAITSITALVKSNPSVLEHLEQVRQYCVAWSAPIAVLTNGSTYMIFIAVRTDGVRWDAGKIIVLSDILGDKFDFSVLQNLLDRRSVTSGHLHRQLLGERQPGLPESVLSQYEYPNAIIPRNAIGMALEPLLRSVFSDVSHEDSAEVLDHCYVYPGESSLRDVQFETLLLDRPPSYVTSVVSLNSLNAYKKFHASMQDYLSRGKWAQTVLLIGGVGVGKTMFLRRFFRQQIKDEKGTSRTVQFYIDFRKPGVDPNQIASLIYDRLVEQLFELEGKEFSDNGSYKKFDFSSTDALQQIFWPQYQRFLRGPQGELETLDATEFAKEKIKFLASLKDDKNAFVRGAFRVLRERYHRHVCLAIDNADQCKPEYQENVYLYSRTLESDLQCLIIVALREEWYWHFGIRRSDGPLSAYHDIVFHVPAPRSREVLAKRLDYALSLAEDYKIPAASINFGQNIVLEAGHLAKYLRVCREAFFENEDITLFYEMTSNGVVRAALDIFLDFIRSGHTHIDEYLRSFIEGGSYTLTLHQVFKPVAYGDYRYYRSHRSRLPNLFNPLEDGKDLSYFARAYVLRWLCDRRKAPSPAGDGYVPIGSTKAFAVSLGLSNQAVSDLLLDLVNRQLIEPDIRLAIEPSTWKFMRATGFGYYLTANLAGQSVYLEAVMLDTPIADTGLRNRISGLYKEGVKPPLNQRFLCQRDFLEQLKMLEAGERLRLSPEMAAEVPSYMPWVEAEFIRDVERVEKSSNQQLLFGRFSKHS